MACIQTLCDQNHLATFPLVREHQTDGKEVRDLERVKGGGEEVAVTGVAEDEVEDEEERGTQVEVDAW